VRKGNIFDPRNLRTGTLANLQPHTMNVKNIASLWVLVGLLSFAFNSNVEAQDDLYYNPSTDATAPTYSNEYTEQNNVTRRYNEDDGYSDEDNDYAYEYSSRIRRFHRPARTIDYYDPFFADMYFYDPFFSPGMSIYTFGYNDFWSYRRWQRQNRWNNFNNFNNGFGMGWNSWGWNSCYSGFNAWNNPWAMNNYFYDPYWTVNGYNPYFGNNFGNNWVDNNYYYNNGSNGGNNGGNNGGYSPQTYTGPRRNGSSVNPGYARLPETNGRLTTAEKHVPVVEKSARVGRTAGDYESPSTISPATRNDSPAGRNKGNANGTVRGVESPRNIESAEKPSTRGADPTGRTPEATPRRSTEPTGRSQDVTPSRRDPATRGNDGGYTPSRTPEATPPSRTSKPRPTRRSNEGATTPRRRESSQQESGRSRSAEERSASPSRSSESRSESRSSRSESSSPRSYDSGSSRGSSNSGSSGRSSSGSSGSGSSGGGSKSSGSKSGGGRGN